jgi:hypothetical protein
MDKIRMYDARLPGAWLDSDTLRKVRKAAGQRGFGAWIRAAIDAHLRDAGAKPSAHTAKPSAHLDAENCEAECALATQGAGGVE